MSTLVFPCPCCSNLEYENCCKPFHDGILPENALQLMRSRYSAYALNIPDYIMRTTHLANSQYSKDTLSWKRNIIAFSQNTIFHKLVIQEFIDGNVQATVTFTAHLSQNMQDATFTEKSSFEKINGQWLYLKDNKPKEYRQN